MEFFSISINNERFLNVLSWRVTITQEFFFSQKGEAGKR